MKKTLIILVGILILCITGFYVLNSYIYNEKQGDQAPAPVASHKDATYVIDGKVVMLKDGKVEVEAAPGSSSKIVTQYFGNEVKADFDNDGREDVAFILTQQTGGSGTFYYVVAALNKVNGYEGSQGLLLGDRIAPQTTEINEKKLVVVNYSDRRPGEDFSVKPSVGKSIQLLLDVNSMQFGEVAKDFEGEADPKVMNLGMKSWTWINVTYSDGTVIKPKQTLAFTLEFNGDETFSATTDCNRFAGKVVTKNGSIDFSDIISTKMYCEGSQETDFHKVLDRAAGYLFTSKGELVLDLERDSGSAIFK
ncbi:MAG: META domain-containing protein [Patescibacteria group bacterium]